MFVEVNGARLYFDVEGAGLVPDGPKMRAKPADLVQIVYLDHRGNGRSSGEDPKTWNLAQWGDDVRRFCDVLGIEKPHRIWRVLWRYGRFRIRYAASWASRQADPRQYRSRRPLASRATRRIV
jgi:pimeloyl-ACP methyl ester carboxylesterase